MSDLTPEELAQMDEMSDEEVAEFKQRGPAIGLEQVRERTVALAAADGPGMLVAEGDSWFDYLPGTDVIDCLRRHHGHVIENYAEAGDTLENMIYGTNINDDFQRVRPTIETVLRRLGQLKPKVFLFSGGGNDVAGDHFESYLNHKNSGLSTVREEFVDDIVNVVFRKYFEDLIEKVSTVSPTTHIVLHGYGHTVPTGKGVNFLFFTFAGPWLRPALAKKGIFDDLEQRSAVERLINAFNDMLADLADNHPSSRFHHVDLRDDIDREKDWVNELHLRNSAYARVAKTIHEKIQSV